MDEETLAALTSDTDEPAEGTSPGPSQAPDLGEPETVNPDTPEAQIARGEIPEGYTRDTRTGEVRPKKAKGRPRGGSKPPAIEGPVTRTQDEAPNSKARGKVHTPAPPYRKGVIAAGMTKLYQRTGRLVRAMDRDLGIAIIESAEDCGEAWEELARTNPRVRTFLMKLVSGGAWGSVIMAHAPIFMALIMKEKIRKHIPMMGLINSMMSDDEDVNEDGDDENPFADLFGGMNPDDMQNMMNMAMGMMGQTAGRMSPGRVIRGETVE